MKNVRNEGFTLIELLLVIVVLGILASIAIPRLANIQDKAHDTKIAVMADNIKTGLEAYYQEHDQQYPAADTVNNDWNVLDSLLIAVDLGAIDKYNIGDKHTDVSEDEVFSYTLDDDGDYQIKVGSNSTGEIYIITVNNFAKQE